MAITLKEAIKKLEESGKTISDKDRKEMMEKPKGRGGMPPAKMRQRKPKASRKLERLLSFSSCLASFLHLDLIQF